MALSTTGIAATESPIRAAHVTQYYDLLTGAMTDQPVTLKNHATIGGGGEATSDHKLSLVGVSSQTGLMLRFLLALGDANPSFSADKNGKLSWGAGGASAVDTTLERQAAGYLRSNGGFDLAHVTTPGAPGAGYARIYFKSDDLPYYRSGAAGAETLLNSAGTYDPLLAQVFGG